MMVTATPAFVGARGVDAVQLIDAEHATNLKASGIDFAVQYLGSVTKAGVTAILAAGLGFMPVTYADKFDADATVRQLTELELPPGVTVWLDVEGVADMDPFKLILAINAWADAVAAAGFMPGIYIGSPQILTSAELYALHVVRYWRAPSRVMDRHGQLAEPGCGWCMIQCWDSRFWAAVWSDVDIIQKDYRNRLPSWAIAA